jgi:hypothetical protein
MAHLTSTLSQVRTLGIPAASASTIASASASSSRMGEPGEERRATAKVRAEISSHSAAGPQARWRGASDDAYLGAVREERATKPAGLRAAARRRVQGIRRLKWADGTPSGFAIRNISPAGPVMTADVSVPW